MKKIFLITALILTASAKLFAQAEEITVNRRSVAKSVDSLIEYTPTVDTQNQNLLTYPLGSNYRWIYWVHGLGGNEQSWLKAATATESGVYKNGQWVFLPREAECDYQITYNEGSDFLAAAGSLYGIINSKRPGVTPNTRSNDFLVSHSQGGLVSRFLDWSINNGNPNSYNRDFGGIVTFATPHRGAKIIDNVQNTGMVDLFFTDACKNMAAGPAAESVGDTWIVRIFGIQQYAIELSESLCNVVGDFGQGFAKFYTGALGNEYKTTSSALQTLNSYTTTTPSVCFYGRAPRAGIASNILYSYTKGGANDYDFFEAQNSTDQARTELNNTMNEYQMKYEEYKLRWVCGFVWYPPFYRCRWEGNQIISSAYSKGINFMKNADDRWLDIIGARSTYSTYEQITFCISDDDDIGPVIINRPSSSYPSLGVKYGISPYDDEDNDPVDYTPTNPCPPGFTPITTTRWITKAHYKESDGIVLEESASEFKGALHKVLLNGSNHEQIKNDNNTKTALTQLYSGNRGEYFFIPEKEQ